ncbi:MAG: hypothetical protein JWM08_240, partial [Candidatus Angelobacter sp.]|nr:hypothetical protein [Candidatus Angelobacter sp.]
MGHFTADATTDATIQNGRHRVLAQQIRILLDRERRAAGETYAGVVAGTGVGVHAEPLAHHTLSFVDPFFDQ